MNWRRVLQQSMAVRMLDMAHKLRGSTWTGLAAIAPGVVGGTQHTGVTATVGGSEYLVSMLWVLRNECGMHKDAHPWTRWLSGFGLKASWVLWAATMVIAWWLEANEARGIHGVSLGRTMGAGALPRVRDLLLPHPGRRRTDRPHRRGPRGGHGTPWWCSAASTAGSGAASLQGQSWPRARRSGTPRRGGWKDGCWCRSHSGDMGRDRGNAAHPGHVVRAPEGEAGCAEKGKERAPMKAALVEV